MEETNGFDNRWYVGFLQCSTFAVVLYSNIVVGPIHFDIAEKIKNYSGYGKFYRLKHMASNSIELYPEIVTISYAAAKVDSKEVNSMKTLSRAYHLVKQNYAESGEWILEREKHLFQEVERLNDRIENTNRGSESDEVAVSQRIVFQLLISTNSYYILFNYRYTTTRWPNYIMRWANWTVPNFKLLNIETLT